jgi:hypothetical protein
VRDIIKAYNVLVGKTETKTPLGRPRHRWEDSIEIDLKECIEQFRTGLI